MRKIYCQKLDIVLNEFEMFPNKISIIGGNSGLQVVLVITNGMSEEELGNRVNTMII